MDMKIPALHEAYADMFRIGAAVNTHTLQQEGKLIARHFNSLTAENQMKFGELHPEEGRYDFAAADEIADFAVRHEMGLRGHTLVWHNQTSDWVFRDPATGEPASRELLLERLKSHIDTVVGRYKGKIYAWDVVNEAIEDKKEQVLRSTKWLELLGEDYLLEAFRLAHEADPDALLFYNDYNETDPVKRVKIYNLVRSLLEKGAPIHGIGMQAHWNIYGPTMEEIRETIELYATLGVQIHITELDMSMFRFGDERTDLKEPTPEMEELQAQRYEDIFQLFREYQSVITSVTFWGASDKYTWLDNFPIRGRKNWPFLFDTALQPKDSFWRVIGLGSGAGAAKKAVGKLPTNGNPLAAHKFGADPYALVFGDRVYLYMTSDKFEYDEAGEIKENTYSSINKLTVLSSSDLLNWSDHGEVPVAGPDGLAQWASQSWAPAAAHRIIDGKNKFFLYFANNASSIGVLSADSPTGPWIDPIGKPLITRTTPGVEDVKWLFDPAVLVDDDDESYIYFGGGVPDDQYEWPDTTRVMRLGRDMTSVLGRAENIPAPYVFEDAGIHKVNGTYYFTYCSNFYEGERAAGSPPPGEIAYMTSSQPMGPWTYQGTLLKNPGHFFSVSGNNHHAVFSFQGEWYIAYHAQTLSKALGHPKGYRSTHLNLLHHESDGSIREVEADLAGVKQLKSLDPYIPVEGSTMAWSAGVTTEAITTNREELVPFTGMVLTDIHQGDWIALAGVDFGEKGASVFAAVVSGDAGGSIELRLDCPDGRLIGALSVSAAEDRPDHWLEQSTEVSGAQGVHDLYLVFSGEPDKGLFRLGHWWFIHTP